MKKNAVLLLFLLSTFFSFAQNLDFYRMVPFKKGNKWGVMSRQKEVFYPAQLDTFLFQEIEDGMVSLFARDESKTRLLAKVVYKGKPMYLTTEGKLLPASFSYKIPAGPMFVPPQVQSDDYEDMSEASKDPEQFAEGLVIDSFPANRISTIMVKIARHGNGFHFLLNGVHEPAFDCESYIKPKRSGVIDFVLLKKEGKYGCANFLLKKLVIPFLYDKIDFGRMPVTHLHVQKGSLRGVMDHEGNTLVPVRFAEVMMNDTEPQQQIKAFVVRRDSAYYLYNIQTGDDQNAYDDLMPLYGGYSGEVYYWATKGKNQGILKADGTIAAPFNYSMINGTEMPDVFRLQQDKKRAYFIVRENPYLVGEKYTRIGVPIKYTSGQNEDNYYLFFAQLKGKWFLVDSYGTEFIE